MFNQKQQTRRRTPTERGVGSIEIVSLAIAVLATLGGIAFTLHGSADSIATTSSKRIEQAVTAPSATRPTSSATSPISLMISATRPRTQWRWAAAERSATATGSNGNSARSSICAGCAGATATWDFGSGSAANTRRDEKTSISTASVFGRINARVHASIVAAQASARYGFTAGPLTASSRTEASARIGAEASVRGSTTLSKSKQQIALSGRAVAGATARAEQEAGVSAMGISLKQNAAIEGWVGAGATGTVSATRSQGRLEWKASAGAALGLGGAIEVGGSIDISGAAQRYRKVAVRSLEIASRSILLPAAFAQATSTAHEGSTK